MVRGHHRQQQENNNHKSKMGKYLAGTALYRSLMVYHHGHILAKQVAYFKALGRDTSIFSYHHILVGDETEFHHCPCFQLNFQNILLIQSTITYRLKDTLLLWTTDNTDSS